jgi:hypothetical protein
LFLGIQESFRILTVSCQISLTAILGKAPIQQTCCTFHIGAQGPRPRALCGQNTLNDELELLKDTFRQNSYSGRQTCMVLNPAVEVAQLNDMLDSAAFLPYVRSTSNCINRVLSPHNIKSVGVLLRNISKFPSAGRELPGTEDTRNVQHPLQVLSGLHWTDMPFNWCQHEGAWMACLARISRQVSHDST